MKKSCILAPIHEPKFVPYGLDFISSYNSYFDDEDIFLIFSSKEESDQFKLISKNLKYNSIICDEPIGPSPITQKKIFGLKYIFNNTDFDKVGAMDVDAIFIKNIDYEKQFSKYIENKIIYSTYSFGYHNPHIKCPIKYFNNQDIEHIYQKTHEFKAYFWFNDIPIYYKKYFLDFLNYINYEKNINKLEHGDFDFIMYVYYLLVKDIVKLEFLRINNNIINIGYGFTENQLLFNQNDFENVMNTFKPMWVKQEVNQQFMKNVFVKLHLDRS
jgi:hypothetical protein